MKRSRTGRLERMERMRLTASDHGSERDDLAAGPDRRGGNDDRPQGSIDWNVVALLLGYGLTIALGVIVAF
jgi:hypothetical protein